MLPPLILGVGMSVEGSGSPSVNKPRKLTPEQIQASIKQAEQNLISLNGGTFEMGDWGFPNGLAIDADLDSKPLHTVSLDPFAMLKYKVTYAEFDTFTDAVGAPRINMDALSRSRREPQFPASVSWYGAHDYCAWLAKVSKKKYALPTEAQWEYAARSGGSKEYLYATDNGRLEEGRNFPSEFEEAIRPVGSRFLPNPAGFYAMSEWTHEWVDDWYDQHYYSVSPEKNPTGPKVGKTKVIRGANGSPQLTALVIARYHRLPKRNDLDLSETDKKFDTRYSDIANYSAFRCVVN